MKSFIGNEVRLTKARSIIREKTDVVANKVRFMKGEAAIHEFKADITIVVS